MQRLIHRAGLAAVLAIAGSATGQVIIVPGATLQAVSPDGTCAMGTMNGNAIRWTAGAGVQTLGPGTAYASSADGSVVVGTSNGNAFRWTAATGMVTLGPISWHGPSVSHDGNTVVFGAPNNVAYRWTPATGTVAMPGFNGPSSALMPYAISGNGGVVVGTANYPGALQAAVWGPTGPANGLPWLNNFHDAAATTVSGDGRRVIGYSSVSSNGADVEATYWDADGTIHRMYSPNSFIRLFGANEDGTIAVGISFSHSYVWREGMGFRDLNDTLLEDFGVDFGANWTQAWGLSSDGKTIVGYNSTDHGPEGFIVHLPRSIPGPGAAGVLGLGAVAWARRRRCH